MSPRLCEIKLTPHGPDLQTQQKATSQRTTGICIACGRFAPAEVIRMTLYSALPAGRAVSQRRGRQALNNF